MEVAMLCVGFVLAVPTWVMAVWLIVGNIAEARLYADPARAIVPTVIGLFYLVGPTFLLWLMWWAWIGSV